MTIPPCTMDPSIIVIILFFSFVFELFYVSYFVGLDKHIRVTMPIGSKVGTGLYEFIVSRRNKSFHVGNLLHSKESKIHASVVLASSLSL